MYLCDLKAWPQMVLNTIFFLLLALYDVSESRYPQYGHLPALPPAVQTFCSPFRQSMNWGPV